MATTPETQPEEQPENDLAALIDPIRPYIEQYGSKIILGLAAILIVAAGYIYLSRSANAEKARGWDELIQTGANTAPEDFGDIAEDNPGTSAAEWALLRQAEGFLKRGVQSAFTNRKESTASYEKAREALNRLLNKSGTSVLIRERALYTMALLTESDSGADTSEAIKAYERLKSEFKDSVYIEQADVRIEALKTPEVQKFYGWFKDQNPSIADPLSVPNDPIGTTLPIPGAPLNPDAPILPGGVETPETPGEPEGNESTAGTVPEGGSEAPKPSEGAGETPETPPVEGSGETKPAEAPQGGDPGDK